MYRIDLQTSVAILKTTVYHYRCYSENESRFDFPSERLMRIYCVTLHVLVVLEIVKLHYRMDLTTSIAFCRSCSLLVKA
jgi:hypothetical protein